MTIQYLQISHALLCILYTPPYHCFLNHQLLPTLLNALLEYIRWNYYVCALNTCIITNSICFHILQNDLTFYKNDQTLSTGFWLENLYLIYSVTACLGVLLNNNITAWPCCFKIYITAKEIIVNIYECINYTMNKFISSRNSNCNTVKTSIVINDLRGIIDSYHKKPWTRLSNTVMYSWFIKAMCTAYKLIY